MQVPRPTLRARPDAPGPTPDDLAEVALVLADAAAARRAQLAALPPAADVVAVAHRESVRRILSDICAAQAQLADGTYGTCTRCTAEIDSDLVRSCPWAVRCDRCTAR